MICCERPELSTWSVLTGSRDCSSIVKDLHGAGEPTSRTTGRVRSLHAGGNVALVALSSGRVETVLAGSTAGRLATDGLSQPETNGA